AGIVFRATDLNLDRDVAIKILSREAVRDHDTLRKFEQESQILRRLHAQNTVFFYDCGRTTQNLPYIVMELVRGQQLKDLLFNEGRLSPKRTVAILVQVLSALSEAHQFGFIHRDLKPGNIMLCTRPGFPDDFVKVLDFGIAKFVFDDSSTTGDFAGTPKYMPPEVFRNEPVTMAADLYSVGCIAYEMLTGVAPFDGDTFHVTVSKHLFMTPRSFPSDVEQYPNLVATVFKLLEKMPENRFTTAQKVIDVLEHWSEPELIPELVGCRLKGDDAQTGNFFDEDASGSVPALDIPEDVAESQTVPFIPTMAMNGHVSFEEEKPINPLKPLPSKFPEKRAKWVLPLIIAGAVILVVGVAFAIIYGFQPKLWESMFGQEQPVEKEDPSLPSAESSAPAAAQSPYYELANSTSTISMKSSLDAVAFGMQSGDSLMNLGRVPDAENELSETGAPGNSDSLKKKSQDDAAAGPGSPDGNDQADENAEDSDTPRKRRHRHKKQTSDTPPAEKLEKFTLMMRYSPDFAQVSFVNSEGSCQPGLCKVRTTSDTAPARIVVSAKGYKSKSVLLTQKVASLKIELTVDPN
ncbi:MAG: serine/threonine protein kinase, partial [Proteobacteria bacterium]|nr:serine/threonine protein kinase [Pseudomonadota bacterium]